MLAALSGEGDRGPAFEALCRESRARHDELLPELTETGIDLQLRKCGVLNVALTDAEAAELHEGFADKPGHLLTGTALAEAEPGLTQRAVAGHLLPDQRYLDPAALTRAL